MLFIFILFLAGCTVGPNFQAPITPATQQYTSPWTSDSVKTAGPLAPRFVYGRDIPAEWWKVFQCAPLDKVIRLALAGSPTLDAAQATLRQAREEYNADTGAAFYPAVDAGFSASRQKISNSAFGQSGGKGTIFNLLHPSINVAYFFDFFGGARRELESLRAKVNYQQFQMEAAALTLTSNIVAAVGKEVALRAQLEAWYAILDGQEQQLKMLEQQFTAGGVSRFDVLSQKTRMEQTRSAFPPLEKELAFTRHQLSVLIGKMPGEEADLPVFHMEDIKLPAELPVTLPSALARQRPDIRAAEELLAAASAKIGAAQAAFYPQVTLTGSYGPQANRAGDLFKENNLVGNITAGIFQPLFNGGELRAKRRQADAVYDEAAAVYRQTILLAFQNVADVLRALEADAAAIKTQFDTIAAAKETLDMAQKQFQAGAVSHLALLDAQRQFEQARIGVIQAQAQRFTDTAALFQALGGGWMGRAGIGDRR
ncbi:MAG: efflux transporter outer membrane subunit [Candidatus Omnitrophica bacterium]|nr:efflux transporter outer membrane subunit [Candidatus Omnitrophota bacterium]